MTARLALALALLAGCKRGCDRDAPTPPPVSPTPSQPTTDLTIPTAQSPIAFDVPRWEGAAGATRDEAVSAALGTAGATGHSVYRELDADGDGRQDALTETPESCVLARRAASGWIADVLRPGSSDGNVICSEPSTIGGEALLVGFISPQEMGRDPAYFVTPATTALFVARPGQRLLRVYEASIDQSADDSGDWTYDPNPDGTLAVLDHVQHASVGDAQTFVGGYMLLRWNTARTALEQASCWQSARPIAPRDAIPGCTARITAPQNLRARDDHPRALAALTPGTLLRIVNADALTHANTRLYCVRTPDGTFGHALLADAELTGCPVPIP